MKGKPKTSTGVLVHTLGFVTAKQILSFGVSGGDNRTCPKGILEKKSPLLWDSTTGEHTRAYLPTGYRDTISIIEPVLGVAAMIKE